MNTYIDTIIECVDSGSFSKLGNLDRYVSDFILDADPETLETLNSLHSDINAVMEDADDTFSESVRRSADSPCGVWLATWLGLKLAWLTAAQIARLAGYPCSATLVEYSVYGWNYTETNGQFRNKIVRTSTYQNLLNQVIKGNKRLNQGYVLTHTKGENKDLYYSLHSCTYTVKKSGSKYSTSVYDKYDFKLDFKYDNIFSTCVNNWAWLCSNTGVLYVIKVNITIK